MPRSLSRLPAWLLVPLLVVATACGTTEPAADAPETSAPGRVDVAYTEISDSIDHDEELEALIAPYRDRMETEVETVIANAPEELTEGRPEGPLGNLAADAMLHHARELSEGSVHMAMTNNGGLRIPIGPGDITVGTVYELMPFENRLVVVTLSGADVVTFAEQIMEIYGGEPIAGFSFRVHADSGDIEDLQVGGTPIDLEAEYRVVTSDYLADGGGPPVLEEAPREELPMLLRDAFIEYFRDLGTLTAEIEGRIERIE